MESKIEENNGERTVVLSGRVNIEDAPKLRDLLLDSLKSSDNVSVNLKNAEDFDLACLQVLCSAHHTAGTMGKSFSIADSYPEVLEQTVNDSGLLRNHGCMNDVTHTCIWVEKKWKEHKA